MLKTVFGTILMLSGTLVLTYQGGGLFAVYLQLMETLR